MSTEEVGLPTKLRVVASLITRQDLLHPEDADVIREAADKLDQVAFALSGAEAMVEGSTSFVSYLEGRIAELNAELAIQNAIVSAARALAQSSPPTCSGDVARRTQAWQDLMRAVGEDVPLL